MDTIASSEFRKTYGKLTNSTVVTANGHVIGIWNPSTPMSRSVARAFDVPEADALRMDPGYVSSRAEAQTQRDAILRKINKGG